jgi:hypothetical protein
MSDSEYDALDRVARRQRAAASTDQIAEARRADVIARQQSRVSASTLAPEVVGVFVPKHIRIYAELVRTVASVAALLINLVVLAVVLSR